ncbi:MAG: hypothetical protein VX737_05265, partial [Pseudomonadota bacterium]|nr:hypothetical protein [Pseudomonadota bacterium]
LDIANKGNEETKEVLLAEMKKDLQRYEKILAALSESTDLSPELQRDIEQKLKTVTTAETFREDPNRTLSELQKRAYTEVTDRADKVYQVVSKTEEFKENNPKKILAKKIETLHTMGLPIDTTQLETYSAQENMQEMEESLVKTMQEDLKRRSEILTALSESEYLSSEEKKQITDTIEKKIQAAGPFADSDGFFDAVDRHDTAYDADYNACFNAVKTLSQLQAHAKKVVAIRTTVQEIIEQSKGAKEKLIQDDSHEEKGLEAHQEVHTELNNTLTHIHQTHGDHTQRMKKLHSLHEKVKEHLNKRPGIDESCRTSPDETSPQSLLTTIKNHGRKT